MFALAEHVCLMLPVIYIIIVGCDWSVIVIAKTARADLFFCAGRPFSGFCTFAFEMGWFTFHKWQAQYNKVG